MKGGYKIKDANDDILNAITTSAALRLTIIVGK